MKYGNKTVNYTMPKPRPKFGDMNEAMGNPMQPIMPTPPKPRPRNIPKFANQITGKYSSNK